MVEPPVVTPPKPDLEDYQLVVTSEDSPNGNVALSITIVNPEAGWEVHKDKVLLANATTESSSYLTVDAGDGYATLIFNELAGKNIGLDIFTTADFIIIESEWTSESDLPPRVIEFNKFADNVGAQKFNVWSAKLTAPKTLPKHITDITHMFENCENFMGDVSAWDVSHITDFSYTFDGCRMFNADLSGWNVSNVTNMERAFAGCESFNSDLSSWNVANVKNFNATFIGARSFNSDVSSWNTSSATNMREMFRGISSFASIVENWDVSNVTDMEYMFQPIAFEETGLPAQNLSKWCVRNIIYEPNGFLPPLWEGQRPVWGTCPTL